MSQSLLNPLMENPRPPEVTAAVLESSKRIVYFNHQTRSSSWLPPLSWWSKLSQTQKLPYGWECATNSETNQNYFINHVSRTVSGDCPVITGVGSGGSRSLSSDNDLLRTVVLYREPELGFGFVVGSDRPVIVRCVTKNGPSDGKLLAGDQIIFVNGINVRNSPREQVISLIKTSPKSVEIAVKQPNHDRNGSGMKSSGSSTLRSTSKQSRVVRFAENVYASENPTVSSGCAAIPAVAGTGIGAATPITSNILKVYLENGQTKSFKFDTTTTVQNVLDSLATKLCLESTEYFGLLIETACYRNEKRTKSNLLNPRDHLMQIVRRNAGSGGRYVFRVAYVPHTPATLAQKDRHAFDYFYRQCCNDVLKEKFHPELDRDTILHLAALQIYQQALTTVTNYSVTVKTIEKHDFYDLNHFVPATLLESLKRKEVVRILKHYLKIYLSTTSAASLPKKSGKTLTVFQAKLLYLDIISQLPSYGAKCFNIFSVSNSSLAMGAASGGGGGNSATNCSYQTNTVLIVSPKFGISQIFTDLGLNSMPTKIANLDEVLQIRLKSFGDSTNGSTTTTADGSQSSTSDLSCCFLNVALTNDRFIDVLMEQSDAYEISFVLKGLCLVLFAKRVPILDDMDKTKTELSPSATHQIDYFDTHHVIPEKWSYYSDSLKNRKKAQFANIPDYQTFQTYKNLTLDDLLSSSSRSLKRSQMKAAAGMAEAEAEAAKLIADSEQYLKQQQGTGDDGCTTAAAVAAAAAAIEQPTFLDQMILASTSTATPESLPDLKLDDIIDLTDESALETNDMLLSGEFSSMNLEEFLEKMIVSPPEPSNSASSVLSNPKDSSSKSEYAELSIDDIRKFIIPPPPVSPSLSLSSSTSSSSTSLYAANDNTGNDFRSAAAAATSSSSASLRKSNVCAAGPSNSAASATAATNCSNCCQKQNDSEDDQKEPKYSSTIDHLLKKTIYVLNELLHDLNLLSEQCVIDQQQGGGRDLNESLFQTAKNELMTETLNLVTTSKTLIIAMSDMETQSQQLAEHLATCLTIIRKMYNLSVQLVEHMSGPLQTRNLIVRFTSVIEIFKHLLDVSEMDKSSQKSIEEFLAARAEELANTLANLLRSLRIFP